MTEQPMDLRQVPSGRWMRAAVIVFLLGALMLTAAISLTYFRTGRPIGRLPLVPPALSGLLNSPPQYDSSIYGVVSPMGVAVASDGSTYVAESGGERMVRHFDRNGKLIAAFAPPGTTAGTRVPVYVAVSPKGDVYVSDRQAETIYIYSPLGELTGHVPSPFGDEGWQPLGVSFDHDGNIYVTDVTPDKHRVLVLDQKGSLKLSFGKQGSGDGDFLFPNQVAVDATGRMFVSDGNNGRVQMFDPSGKFLGLIGRGATKGDLALPRGLAVDDSDHLLFVVDTSRHAVQYYDISGTLPAFVNSFGNSGNEETDLAFPTGISVSGGGRVYVSDREHNRVTAWRY